MKLKIILIVFLTVFSIFSFPSANGVNIYLVTSLEPKEYEKELEILKDKYVEILVNHLKKYNVHLIDSQGQEFFEEMKSYISSGKVGEWNWDEYKDVMKRMKLPLPDYIIYLSFKEERMKKYLDIVLKLYKENFSLEFQKIERIIYESHRVDIDQEIRNIAEEHFWEIIQQLFPDAEDLPIVDRDPNSLHEQAEMNKHVFIEGERLKIKIRLKRREVIGNNVYVYVFYSKGNQIYAKAKEKNAEVGEKDESMGIGGIGPWITIEGTVGLPKGFNEESYNEEVLIIISRIKLKEISPDTVQLKDLRKILLNIDSEGKDWDILRFFYTIKKLGG